MGWTGLSKLLTQIRHCIADPDQKLQKPASDENLDGLSVIQQFYTHQRRSEILDVTNAKELRCPGPSCSKLTMLLVNDSLKFTSSDTQIC